MNLKETLIAKKKLTHNSPLRKELYENYSSKLKYHEVVYLYLNDLKIPPVCPFSGNSQYFYSGKYCGYSYEYYFFIRHDSHVKSNFFTWLNLFNYGLNLNAAHKLLHSKSLLCARLMFPGDAFNYDIIKASLEKNGYLLNAIDIFLQFDITNIDDILNFIEHLYKCSTAKNNTQEYFLNRGYNINDTKIELHKVFDTWKKFNSNVDKSSEKYKLWLESRKPGLKATRSSLRSKFEKKIYEALKSDFKINLKFYTKVNNVNFSKSIFKHDFYINDQLIVEYNGTYWHKDMFFDNRFNDISVYTIELLRAKISINTHQCKYLILWEADIKNDIEKVKHLIQTALLSSDKFYSSRAIDIELFKQLNYQ